MYDIYYTADAQLNNEYERYCFTQDKYYKSPEAYAQEIDEAEKKGEHKLAVKLKKDLTRQEKAYNEIANRSFFPLKVDHSMYTLDHFIKKYKNAKVLHNMMFYHGSSSTDAETIRNNGFLNEHVNNRILDSGFGSYLTLQQNNALNYAQNDPNAIVTVKIKPLTKIAIYTEANYHLVQNIFYGMAQQYVRRYFKEKIEKDFEGTHIILNDLDRSTIKMYYLPMQLTNLFTRNFFERMGFQGIYAPFSSLAGCSYLNIFRPQEHIESIT